MNERQDPGGGGLTGATGDLTPADIPEPQVPGERREIEDAAAQGDVTTSRGASAPAQQGERGEPGFGPDTGDSTDAPRDAGYGSEHGLNPDDPAYRMESRPSSDEEAGRRESGPTVAGGDDVADSEERF